MNVPSLVFGLILSTLYGAGFHTWRGGGMLRLGLYLVLGWLGFWGGQFLAARLEWTFDLYGDLHLVVSSLCCFVALALGYWLSPRQSKV